MPKKKEETAGSILLGGLFSAIGWTIVYYVASWTALLGLGALVHYLTNRKKSKK